MAAIKSEQTSARVAKIASRILAAVGFVEFYSSDWRRRGKAWKEIQTVAASALTQTADHADHATLRAGKLPRGHKVVRRHKPVTRNGNERERLAKKRRRS